MRELHWTEPIGGIELRLGAKPPIFRFCVSGERRSGTSSFFLSKPGESSPGLPGVFLPLVDVDGRPVEKAKVVENDTRAALAALPAKRILDPRHPQNLEPPVAGPAVRDAIWIDAATAQDVERWRSNGRLLHALFVRPDESVDSSGSNVAYPSGRYFLRRLPRIIFEEHHLIADNTDSAISMGALLDDFVRRFSDDGSVLPHVRVATGYFYHHGLLRLLALLKHEGVKDLHVLFSGKTDARTAKAITTQIKDNLIPAFEHDEKAQLWQLYRDALESGRLQFRVYTDAFLHAKLFLGWEGKTRFGTLDHSYAVVGSSNLSSSGLRQGGNLELDVTLTDRDVNTKLLQWFDARWEESSLPEPALLEVLQELRPQPPPVFKTVGLFEVWQAGAQGRLESPQRHLALLAQLYADRLARVHLPDGSAFPPSDERELTPSPEQNEGVLALAQRILAARIGFLADSVGLGKTITAIGTAWYLRGHGLCSKAVLIAPKKLFPQWRDDGRAVGAPDNVLTFINRHELERMTDSGAAEALKGADLLVVEEAHEALRTRSNKLWQHLRAHLGRNQACRILLVSATPWNNRREDIFNYLLLAWNEGNALRERYPALDAAPLNGELATFSIGRVGSLTAAQAVRHFETLPRESWRRLFDEVFVQRTRSALVRRYGLRQEYPERQISAHVTPVSEPHDELFASLEEALADLTIPYQEPFRTILRASASITSGEEAEPSNLRRSFLIQLFKRAESSEFALAVSLAVIDKRLDTFQQQMRAIAGAKAPLAALKEWLEQRYASDDPQRDLFDESPPDDDDPDESDSQLHQRVRALCERLTDDDSRKLALHVAQQEVEPDLVRIRSLRAKLTLDLDERSPKGLLLAKIAREGLSYKPILVAAYADTALRAFLRMIALFPDKRIGLALGGEEAWLYRPSRDRARDLSAEEWDLAQKMEPYERRQSLLGRAGRARELDRATLLNAFAPRARHAQPAELVRTDGEVDVLVGTEAISVGHNLQDSTCLIQLDLPWNPMVIEQRIGRIDRRGGGRLVGGKRVVDIHYCWSNAAIEEAVSLRTRLKHKAEQAIADTRFDELLLVELHEEIQRVRRERTDADLGQFLGNRQQDLVRARWAWRGLPQAVVPTSMDCDSSPSGSRKEGPLPRCSRLSLRHVPERLDLRSGWSRWRYRQRMLTAE